MLAHLITADLWREKTFLFEAFGIDTELLHVQCQHLQLHILPHPDSLGDG